MVDQPGGPDHRRPAAHRPAGSTIVAFTSDNGYFLGEHRIAEGKRLPYEPVLSVPLLIRGPGIPSGEVRTDPFTSIDFAPTLLEAADYSRCAAPRSTGSACSRCCATATGAGAVAC